MPTYKIIQAGESDIAIIHELAQKIWWKTYESFISKEQIEYMFNLMYSMEGLKSQLTELHHHFFIIYKADEAVGFASISAVIKTCYRIHKLYILPERQGQNVGRTLLAFIDLFVRKHKVTMIELNVNRHNLNAIAFYNKVGFVVREEVDIPLANFVLNDYVMQRKIVL